VRGAELFSRPIGVGGEARERTPATTTSERQEAASTRTKGKKTKQKTNMCAT
jgi:hypothetical protein